MSYWFEDMSIMWVFIVFNDNCCVFIKFDVRIVWMTSFVFCMYYYCFNNVIFFNNVIWCCLFYCSNDNVINVSIFMIRVV